MKRKMTADKDTFDEYQYKPLDQKYFGFNFLYASDFKRKRIPKGVTGDDVYYLLPYDSTVEYGGYITPRNIFYLRGKRTEAFADSCKEVVFHTHPRMRHDTNAPSPIDLFVFVKFCTRRHVLVAPGRILVMEKTPKHDLFFREFWKVEHEHVVELGRKLDFVRNTDGVFLALLEILLRERGDSRKINYDVWRAEWRDMTENLFGISVRELPRSRKGQR